MAPKKSTRAAKATKKASTRPPTKVQVQTATASAAPRAQPIGSTKSAKAAPKSSPPTKVAKAAKPQPKPKNLRSHAQQNERARAAWNLRTQHDAVEAQYQAAALAIARTAASDRRKSVPAANAKTTATAKKAAAAEQRNAAKQQASADKHAAAALRAFAASTQRRLEREREERRAEAETWRVHFEAFRTQTQSSNDRVTLEHSRVAFQWFRCLATLLHVLDADAEALADGEVEWGVSVLDRACSYLHAVVGELEGVAALARVEFEAEASERRRKEFGKGEVDGSE